MSIITLSEGKDEITSIKDYSHPLAVIVEYKLYNDEKPWNLD